ncbi:hypothetical protein ACJJIW_08220 [Microbulbifer sp. JMSA004]|uniref:hypothetical protein n=1 Tax=Microbulbifer sp. JMSA004 TaxID=3243370 RepID=UPI00403925B7
MNVPSESDWGNYRDDLDSAYAHRIFAGKTNDQVQLDFRRCVLERASELSFMPIKPFQYYMLGFKQFIEKGDFEQFDAPDAANCFISLVEQMLMTKPNFIKPILTDLMPTLEFVSENQLEYEADITIYGFFPVKLDHIKELAQNA